MIRFRHLPVAFKQVDVLIQYARIRSGSRRDLGQSRLLRRKIRISGPHARAAENHVDGILSALSVIVEEEECLVFYDRPAEVAAELMSHQRQSRSSFIAGSVATGSIVERRIRVERLITIELERRSVKLIPARPGYNVDHGASGAPELRGITIGVDLKLLDGVLRKLIWRAARTGATESLTEEGVVVVCAVDLETVQRAALPGETDVAATRA